MVRARSLLSHGCNFFFGLEKAQMTNAISAAHWTEARMDGIDCAAIELSLRMLLSRRVEISHVYGVEISQQCHTVTN